MGLKLTTRTWGRGEVPVPFLHGFTCIRPATDRAQNNAALEAMPWA